ncbi:MAG: hypothetical protein H6865_05820 [Rhodospirillales bacterium]|nr:hypothetical protein [Alphaproteobacteria bacterium]MCB9987139.1 hypothetical protein [Rhodospirillales bacterium]USO08104.1 MAG: hypothetical protein H6866_02475 [Rhodospirillales bacterium]
MDRLYTYPVSTPPPTWPLNRAMLRTMDNALARWKAEGYSWRFGQEIEIIPRSFSYLQESLEYVPLEEIRLQTPALFPSYETYVRAVESGVQPDPAAHIDRLVERLKHEKYAALTQQSGFTRKAMIEQLHEFKTALADSDPKTSDQARFNAWLAHLTLMPWALGGLHGLVEPKFGSYIAGTGWWDAKGVAEFSTPVHENPRDLIRATHRILQRLLTSSPAFGVMPTFINSGAQLNFSIHRDADARNMMVLDDEDSLAFAQKALTGLFGLFHDAPHLIQDHDPLNSNNNVEISVGGDRGNTIRQKPECWELRRNYNSAFVHQARDIALIAAGTAQGVFDTQDLKTRQKSIGLELKPGIMPHIEDIYTKGRSIVSIPHIVLGKARLVDGHLDVPFPIINDYLPDLIDTTVGHRHLDLYTSVPKYHRKPKNLGYPETWQALFRSIKVREDGTFDTAHLHPELQQIFLPLRVATRRKVLEGTGKSAPYGPARLMRALPKLHDATTLKSIFDAAAQNRIAGFYLRELPAITNRRATRVVKYQTGLARLYFKRTEATDADLALLRDTDMASDLVETQIDELFDFSITRDDPEYRAARNVSKAELETRYTTFKAVLPKVRLALEAEIESERAKPAPDNMMISYLQARLEAVGDEKIFMLKSHLYAPVDTLVCHLTNKSLGGYREALIRPALRRSIYQRLYFFLWSAATVPTISLDDLDRSVAEARPALVEVFDALAKRKFDDKNLQRHWNRVVRWARPAGARALDLVDKELKRLRRNSEKAGRPALP